MVQTAALLLHFDARKPGWKALGDVLLHEALLVDARRKALHGDRPVAKVRQEGRRQRLVIRGELTFADAVTRKEQLFGMGNHGLSLVTSRAALSSRMPTKRGWRSLPWRVHSMKATCTTSSGRTQCART